LNFAGILHSVSDQIQNLQNFFTTPNKNDGKDDIKGLVSLHFLRPWTVRRAEKRWTMIKIVLDNTVLSKELSAVFFS
jgi:hypothetical protein